MLGCLRLLSMVDLGGQSLLLLLLEGLYIVELSSVVKLLILLLLWLLTLLLLSLDRLLSDKLVDATGLCRRVERAPIAVHPLMVFVL